MAGDYDVAFTDGSKLEDGKKGAGWGSEPVPRR